MVRIDDSPPFIQDAGDESRELTEEERDELEKNGRFLKLVNLPPHAQAPNVLSAAVANSFSSVGGLNKDGLIYIFKDNGSCTAYLPLVYGDGSEFLETGYFYTAFSVHVDALTKYVIDISDHFIVYYAEGRGTADVSSLPSPSTQGSRELSEKERDDLENTGRFLKVVNLPLNTQVSNVFSVSVANSANTVGKLDKNSPVSIFKEANSCAVYLPLVYNDDSEFLETGPFFAAFVIHVDALTNYIVSVSDRFIVYFSDGRGTADANSLPSPPVPVSGGKDLTEKERDDLENTGRFLKLVNLPLNTQAPNVFSVTVANSANTVGKLDKNSPVYIFRETNSCSAYLPLVYNDGSEFLETGYFFAAFDVRVDALTDYVVSISDRFIVPFTEGRGTADVNNLPSPPAAVTAEPHCLTVINLPPSVSANNFKDVFVYNQSEQVARCKDSSDIVLSADNGKASAKIPLHYSSLDQPFSASGVFYVSFDINIDVNTRYAVARGDQAKVAFVDGNGYFDIEKDIPEKPVQPVPYLAIKGLPDNAIIQQVSSVNVSYDPSGSGTVASCSDTKNIVVKKENGFLIFLIPLTSQLYGGYFLNTGDFYVSFSIRIDVNTLFEYKPADKLLLHFTGGSAEFDLNSFFGLFDASLANNNNNSRPVINAGSSFDVNGRKWKAGSNTTINAMTPNESCLLFLYAYWADSEIVFEFSKTAPLWNPSKKGFYNGARRALWKMIYLKSSDLFLFKTRMGGSDADGNYFEDSFPQFGRFVLENKSDYEQLTATGGSTPAAVKDGQSFGGASNPPPRTVSLDPGLYVVELIGAGGGQGRSFNGFSSGGQGGVVREIVTLNSAASFTAFTGSGGAAAPDVSPPSGTFAIVTTKNYVDYVASGYGSAWNITSSTLVQTDTVLGAVAVYGGNGSMSGGGGGGGGSGTFLYSPGGSYFLLAGGGGGGSGGSYLTPGGGGGSGGSIGPGGGGGGSGILSLSNPNATNAWSNGTSDWNSPGGQGGQGGGLGGGSGGPAASYGGAASHVLGSISTATLSGGARAAAYSSNSLIDPVLSGIPFLYLSYGSLFANAYPDDVSAYRILTVRTSLSPAPAASGLGGSSVSVNQPGSWFHANNAGGAGAAAPALNPCSVSGAVYPFTSISFNAVDYRPGNYNSKWNTPSFFETFFYSDLSLTIGGPQDGAPGSPGGNNRNDAKGGGADSGSAGEINIFKVTQPKK